MSMKFVLCVNDGGYPEALEPRKFYEVIADQEAAAEGLLRIVDESGEDYLYPQSCFIEVPLPRAVEEYLTAA